MSAAPGLWSSVLLTVTLTKPRVCEAPCEAPRYDVTDEDPLAPSALQHEAQLRGVRSDHQLDLVNVNGLLLLSVDVDVHRGPGVLAGDGDDSFSEISPGSNNSLSHHVGLVGL